MERNVIPVALALSWASALRGRTFSPKGLPPHSLFQRKSCIRIGDCTVGIAVSSTLR